VELHQDLSMRTGGDPALEPDVEPESAELVGAVEKALKK